MLSRCSEEEEKKRMMDSSNETNYEYFKQILPYFGYDRETNQRMTDFLDKKYDDRCDTIQTFFKLNSQLRAWFKIEVDETNDPAYETYIKCIYDFVPSTVPCYLRMLLLSYTTFKNNAFIYEGQSYKLTKFLLNKGWISKGYVDEINSQKTSSGVLYACVSRNPIDFLFCSTNQNFTSCENLIESYSFYLGLGALALDPNRVIIFLSSGKIKKFVLKGMEFKHFGYIYRSWGIVGGEKPSGHCHECHEIEPVPVTYLVQIRDYPIQKISSLNQMLSTVLKIPIVKAGTGQFGTTLKNGFISSFNHKMPKYENGKPASIYLDFVGFNYNSKFYDSTSGTTGVTHEIPWRDGFNRLDLNTVKSILTNVCASCGEMANNPHEVGDYIYCQYCFEGRFIFCVSCEEDVPNNTTYELRNGESVCQECVNNGYYEECHHCNYYAHETNIQEIEGNLYCDRCCSRAQHCYNCSNPTFDYTRITFFDNIPRALCSYCLNKFKKCERCGFWFRSECIILFENVELCPGCTSVASVHTKVANS